MGYPTYPEHPTPTVKRIYVASSWRNNYQQAVVFLLRNAGYEVYDFRNPKPGDDGFQWSEIDPAWQSWNANAFREALAHPIADRGFANDFEAMQWADTCVLVLPSGRSAHLEAGWFAGTGRRLFVLMLGENEPELMYKMAGSPSVVICANYDELVERLAAVRPNSPRIGNGWDD